MKKRNLLILLVLFSLMLTVFGCEKKVTPPNTPSTDKVIDKLFIKEGFRITLTSEYEETPGNGFTYSFETKELAVLVYDDLFTNFEEEGLEGEKLTTVDYCDLFISEHNLSESVVSQENDLTTFIYNTESWTFLASVYKAKDCFWVVQFACPKGQLEANQAAFIKYAKSVAVK